MAITLQTSMLDEVFAAQEFAFSERADLLCKCGCHHDRGRCACLGITAHEYEPSGVRIEACACGLPNVPDHECRKGESPDD